MTRCCELNLESVSQYANPGEGFLIQFAGKGCLRLNQTRGTFHAGNGEICFCTNIKSPEDNRYKTIGYGLTLCSTKEKQTTNHSLDELPYQIQAELINLDNAHSLTSK